MTTTAFLVRAILSGLMVALIAFVARRSPGLGGLLASIPLVSTLGMIWLWADTKDTALVADYTQLAFWYFLPSIPMFLLIPALLRSGWNFWPALAAGCGLTVVLYLVTVAITARFGIQM